MSAISMSLCDRAAEVNYEAEKLCCETAALIAEGRRIVAASRRIRDRPGIEAAGDARAGGFPWRP